MLCFKEEHKHQIRFKAINGTLEEQIPVTKLFYSLLEVRKRILDERAGLPGLESTGHSGINVLFEDQ